MGDCRGVSCEARNLMQMSVLLILVMAPNTKPPLISVMKAMCWKSMTRAMPGGYPEHANALFVKISMAVSCGTAILNTIAMA